jgi:hypothetical protein
MRLVKFKEGKVCTIWAIDRRGSGGPPENDPKSFIDSLPEESQKSITAVLIHHADNGPSFNEKKSRRIEGGDGIYEFKNRQGARLFYFYDGPHWRTIITHGCQKPKANGLQREIKKAQEIRAQWLNGER